METTSEDKKKAAKKAYQKKYREEHKEALETQRKKYYKENIVNILLKHKNYYVKNIDARKEYNKKYWKENAEVLKPKQRIYWKENAEVLKPKNKKYYATNSENIKNQHREYERFKAKNDPTFRMMKNLRSRLRDVLKKRGIEKSTKTFEFLGAYKEDIWNHLESQFKEGMTRKNYGFKGWHIDHIIPCASFDLSDPEQQKKCFHYTNLQPLWWFENLEKSDKLDYESKNRAMPHNF